MQIQQQEQILENQTEQESLREQDRIRSEPSNDRYDYPGGYRRALFDYFNQLHRAYPHPYRCVAYRSLN